MKTYQVEVVIKPWKEGGFLAEAPALQGCWCVSDTLEAIVDDIQEVIALAIQARRDLGEPLPSNVKELAPGEQPVELVLSVAVS